MNYAYFSNDGRLLYIASRPSVMVDPDVIEREVSRDADANSIYLDPLSLEVIDRAQFPVEVSYNKLIGLPERTVATMPAGQFIVEDGELEFEADIAETIIVHLDHPRYISQTFEVRTGPEAP